MEMRMYFRLLRDMTGPREFYWVPDHIRMKLKKGTVVFPVPGDLRARVDHPALKDRDPLRQQGLLQPYSLKPPQEQSERDVVWLPVRSIDRL